MTPGTLEIHSLVPYPAVVSENQAFELVVTGYNLQWVGKSDGRVPEDNDGFSIDIQNDTISIELSRLSCFTVPPAIPPNDRPSRFFVPLDGLPAGMYQVSVQLESGCWGNAQYTGEIRIYANAQEPLLHHESPATGQVVSGVGVVRGWACYPAGGGQVGRITYTLDDGPAHYTLPHGSLRLDTQDICQYGHNEYIGTGYGGVFYWGFLSDGQHTITIYLDGQPVDSIDFFVAQPPPGERPEDAGFRKGAEGEYVIEQFLDTDETVIIRWSEADQNFIIVEYD